ncbi:hypothetical protein GmHk_14G042219 [Glycine max]|nr:hypothetical protein GmHk_14G042219 [Glycine max]
MNGVRRCGQGWIGGWIVKKEEGREVAVGVLLAVMADTMEGGGGAGWQREVVGGEEGEKEDQRDQEGEKD